MQRRDFFKLSALVMGALSFSRKAHAQSSTLENLTKEPVKFENEQPEEGDLLVRFLGTGSAGWYQDHTRRRHSSILLDNKVLIDLTESAIGMFPKGFQPEVVFYTHSHGDHFSAPTAVGLGVKRVYVSSTWADICRKRFNDEADQQGRPAPEVIAMEIGQAVQEMGLTITALPGNHVTGYMQEQALIFLVEKGTTKENLGVRLLYATDTGGLQGKATRLAGIDAHIKPGRPITGFIMEATIGIGMEEDFRIFNHSSVDMVTKTIHAIEKTGRYQPKPGQAAYITHMSRRNWPPQDELQLLLERPLRAAWDGLEVVFKC